MILHVALFMAQAVSNPVQQTTSGPCSPIVSGNDNTVTVTCQDKRVIESIKAIVTKLAAKQLDPETVTTKLDEILKGVTDIRQSIAGRRLSDDQRAELLSALTPFKGGRVMIEAAMDDIEAYRFAEDFVEVFRGAGFAFLNFATGADKTGINQMMVMGASPVEGILVAVRDPAKPVAQSFMAALKKAGISNTMRTAGQNDIEIFFGHKPR